MQSVDFVLEGKAYRAWPQSGRAQVASGARVLLPRLYDAEQFVQKLQHNTPETLAPLCELAGLIQPHAGELAQALHKELLVIGLGVQAGSRAMADPQAAQQWRKKQAAPPPMYGTAMQQFFECLPGAGVAAAGLSTVGMIGPATAALGANSSSNLMDSDPSVSSAKSGPNAQSWECLIEVAGRNHFPSQKLVQPSQPKNPWKSRPDNSQPHRSLISIPLENNNPVALAISISAQGGQPILLPLPQPVQPRQKGPPPAAELDTLIIPVRPVLYRTRSNNPQLAEMPQSGHLYVFWKGKLWRELALDNKGVPRDIHVTWERDQRAFAAPDQTNPPLRQAVGHNLDAIWIPFKIGGQHQTGDNGFEMAFYPRQLSWSELDQLENDTAHRRRYTTSLDGLRQYSSNQDFSNFDGATGALETAIPVLTTTPDDPEAAMQNQHHQALAPYRKQNLAAAYLKPTVKRVRIRLKDTYLTELNARQLKEGSTLSLKGQKTYIGTISGGVINAQVDIQESRLTLAFDAVDHDATQE